MSGYTIEDIDIIRKKSGISYQEAVALLEYHNGNLAQALIDLEKNGKIRQESREKKKSSAGKNGFLSFIHFLYRMRVRIRRENTDIINFSIIFCIVCLIFAPYLSIVSCILALILGYRFSFVMHDTSFDQTDLQDTFQHAADNVKSSLGDMARGFSDAFGAQSAKANASDEADTMKGSFFTSSQATGFRSSAGDARTPRRVDSQDGSVHFEDDGNGYASATIE